MKISGNRQEGRLFKEGGGRRETEAFFRGQNTTFIPINNTRKKGGEREKGEKRKRKRGAERRQWQVMEADLTSLSSSLHGQNQKAAASRAAHQFVL